MCSKFFLLKTKYDNYELLNFGTIYLAQLVFLKVCLHFNVIIFLLERYPLSEFPHNELMIYANVLSGYYLHSVVNTIQFLISLGSERLLCNIVSIRRNTPTFRLFASKPFMLLKSYD